MTSTTSPHNLDKVFEALANKHRREIVYLLGLQPHSISRLASARKLSLPAIYKHINQLERANIVTRKKLGRTSFLSLNRDALLVVHTWLSQYHAYWGHNAETLKNYDQYLKGGEKR